MTLPQCPPLPFPLPANFLYFPTSFRPLPYLCACMRVRVHVHTCVHVCLCVCACMRACVCACDSLDLIRFTAWARVEGYLVRDGQLASGYTTEENDPCPCSNHPQPMCPQERMRPQNPSPTHDGPLAGSVLCSDFTSWY